MAGVSSGLSTLHEAAGFHNDLKPENILVFREGNSSNHSFRISDFGISFVHPKGFKTGLPPHPGTGTYEPPECQMKQQQSQKHDIWSLGCVLHEMLVWALKGSDAIESFADDRLKDTPPSDDNFRNDYFFSIELNKSFIPLGVQTRPAVLRWIEALNHNPNCNLAISLALLLIRDGLLQVEQGKRLDADKVSEKLIFFSRYTVREHPSGGLDSMSHKLSNRRVMELENLYAQTLLLSHRELSLLGYGRHDEVKIQFMRAMETRKRVLGQEYPSTLASMANLASKFWNRGWWEEPKGLAVQILKTSSSMLHKDQGKIKEIEFYQLNKV